MMWTGRTPSPHHFFDSIGKIDYRKPPVRAIFPTALENLITENRLSAPFFRQRWKI
jgi:hypothetical protein